MYEMKQNEYRLHWSKHTKAGKISKTDNQERSSRYDIQLRMAGGHCVQIIVRTTLKIRTIVQIV